MPNGFLTVNVTDSTTNRPIEGATINIYSNADNLDSGGTQTQIYQNLKSDISGQVNNVSLQAPDIAYSQQPSDVRPYSQYSVEIIADGYETLIIDGTIY